MTAYELIKELQHWGPNDEVVVKNGRDYNSIEYDIIGVGAYPDFSRKEGGDSPAIIIG